MRLRARTRQPSTASSASGSSCRRSPSRDAMLKPGDALALTVEKPVAGGPMIARHEGRVILVSGAIPGERVNARLTRVSKGVAHADTATVEEPSPDRRAAP